MTYCASAALIVPSSVPSGRLAIRTSLVPSAAISIRTEDISPFESLYSAWPLVFCSTSSTYCRSTNFMNTFLRGPSIWIVVTSASGTCSSCIRSRISYAEIRGLCRSNVQGGSNITGTDFARFTHKQSRSCLNHLVLTRVFCRSSMAIHSHPLPSIRYTHAVNITLHYLFH